MTKETISKLYAVSGLPSALVSENIGYDLAVRIEEVFLDRLATEIRLMATSTLMKLKGPDQTDEPLDYPGVLVFDLHDAVFDNLFDHVDSTVRWQADSLRFSRLFDLRDRIKIEVERQIKSPSHRARSR